MGGKSSKANIQAGDGHCFREFEEEDLEIPSLSGLPLVSARTYVVGLRLTVVQGDITRTATDAMVHPTGSKPGPYGQIGKLLVAAAGPSIQRDMDALPKLGASEVAVTEAHGLQASKVIHVNGPVFKRCADKATAQALLKAAVKNILVSAAGANMGSITLPSIGSGAAGYDAVEAASWIIEAISGKNRLFLLSLSVCPQLSLMDH
jgi:O-acetyl-ADP-ribose deacetylase (regulator of RNase III)